MNQYKYSGARSLILLHKKLMKSFLRSWKQAKSLNVQLPKTDDTDYRSLETLLYHVLNSSGGYLKWICEKLDLPDPEIVPPPAIEVIGHEADKYLTYLFEKWASPLKNVEETKFHNKTYESNWGVHYCIDAMLEHAVMHPLRHEFQLSDLIIRQT